APAIATRARTPGCRGPAGNASARESPLDERIALDTARIRWLRAAFRSPAGRDGDHSHEFQRRQRRPDRRMVSRHDVPLRARFPEDARKPEGPRLEPRPEVSGGASMTPGVESVMRHY